MFSKALNISALAVLMVGAAAIASAQQVSITVQDGRVTLKSENASARQILEEWARVGQAKVVNADKVTGPPLTLTLIDVPEKEALATVLRSAAGYAVVDKVTMQPDTSRFEKILVMARTTPVSTVASGPPAAPPAAHSPAAAAEPAAADEPVVVDNEPPQPGAPVVNPYGAGNTNAPGTAGAGAGMATGAGAGTATGAGGGVNVRPQDTRFDYTNPQQFFEAQRKAQAAAAQSGGTAVVNPYPGSQANPVTPGSQANPMTTGGAVQPQQPSSVPTAGTGTTLGAPGIAPTPQPQQAPPAGQGAGFNPYNTNPNNMPPNSTAGTAPPTTPVEPDRAKYANPYVPSTPQKPPQ
jgi:hypothetical protein